MGDASWDPTTRATVQKIPLLTVKAGPRDKEEWQKRLKEVRCSLCVSRFPPACWQPQLRQLLCFYPDVRACRAAVCSVQASHSQCFLPVARFAGAASADQVH